MLRGFKRRMLSPPHLCLISREQCEMVFVVSGLATSPHEARLASQPVWVPTFLTDMSSFCSGRKGLCCLYFGPVEAHSVLTHNWHLVSGLEKGRQVVEME